MTALVVATLLTVVLALAVVGVVAIPARRQGRDVLTARGEEVARAIKDRTEAVVPGRR